jgi:hypothetical protein
LEVNKLRKSPFARFSKVRGCGATLSSAALAERRGEDFAQEKSGTDATGLKQAADLLDRWIDALTLAGWCWYCNRGGDRRWRSVGGRRWRRRGGKHVHHFDFIELSAAGRLLRSRARRATDGGRGHRPDFRGRFDLHDLVTLLPLAALGVLRGLTAQTIDFHQEAFDVADRVVAWAGHKGLKRSRLPIR